MADEKELFMMQELSFDQRCEKAAEALRRLQKQVQQMSDDEVAYRQQTTVKRISSLEELCGKVAEAVLKIHWDSGVEFTRAMFGIEATEFALRQIKYDRFKNCSKNTFSPQP